MIFPKIHTIILALVLATAHRDPAPASTLVINGQNDKTYSGLNISSTSGDCVQIIDSTNITIQNSQIGPCGTNNTTSNSRGVYVSASSGINLYDNYIHVDNLASNCGSWTHANVVLSGTSFEPISNVNIVGNVIAFGEINIAGFDVQKVNVNGNFLLNARGTGPSCTNPDNMYGHQFQVWADGSPTFTNSDITVDYNYILSDATGAYPFNAQNGDSINFGYVVGGTNHVSHNYIVGSQYTSGCAFVADSGSSNTTVDSNVISQPFNCGIGFAGGSNHVATNNKELQVPPSSNPAAGISINGAACPVTITGNVVSFFQGPGPLSSSTWNQAYYNSGSCASPTLSNNIFDTGCRWASGGGTCMAYKALYPMARTNQPPAIPPSPHACAANSPYTNNTSYPKC